MYKSPGVRGDESRLGKAPISTEPDASFPPGQERAFTGMPSLAPEESQIKAEIISFPRSFLCCEVSICVVAVCVFVHLGYYKKKSHRLDRMYFSLFWRLEDQGVTWSGGGLFLSHHRYLLPVLTL